MKIQHFYDPATFTLTYVVYQEGRPEAVIIDPVWDFDEASGELSTGSLDAVGAFLDTHGLRPTLCLETHAHADHLSGAQPLKRRFPEMQIGISERITRVQDVFRDVFHLEMPVDGRQFDRLLKDHEVIDAAGLKLKILPTPGHTPACTAFLIGDAVFTGDALFMPDFGTGRCDFPKGDARDLYRSVQEELYTLPEATRVFVGHDYQPGGRPLAFESTIGEQRRGNIHLRAETTEAEFVRLRQTRDASLGAPRLLLPSIQVNIRAGHLPESEANGTRYLKLPLRGAD